jgi:hypothetical protein
MKGALEFDPENLTGKHEKQAEWKLVGMLVFPGEDHKYYEWFIRRRYGIADFTKPLRKPHVSYINDAVWEMSRRSETEWCREKAFERWQEYKRIHTGREIEIELDLDVRTYSTFWWLNVTERSRVELHRLRAELGLKERPHFGLHMTVATTNERSYPASRYAHEEVILKFGENGK